MIYPFVYDLVLVPGGKIDNMSIHFHASNPIFKAMKSRPDLGSSTLVQNGFQ